MSYVFTLKKDDHEPLACGGTAAPSSAMAGKSSGVKGRRGVRDWCAGGQVSIGEGREERLSECRMSVRQIGSDVDVDSLGEEQGKWRIQQQDRPRRAQRHRNRRWLRLHNHDNDTRTSS